MPEDTMIPKKPEDSETAIPQDREYLKQELERMLGTKLPDKIMEPTISTTTTPKQVKCTCARQFFTSRRNKKKGLIVMKRQNNGHTNQGCPVHFKH
jgi:hypothetical protein